MVQSVPIHFFSTYWLSASSHRYALPTEDSWQPAPRRPAKTFIRLRNILPLLRYAALSGASTTTNTTPSMTYEERLTGGHPNSLGNTIEVVEDVLKHPERLEELYQCYFSEDEVVRLRVSNAMKRLAKANGELLLPYLSQFLEDISQIDQASTKWTLAQLFQHYTKELSASQRAKAKAILRENLDDCDDWIVQNHTMQTLAEWSEDDPELKGWLLPRLEQRLNEPRKSVRKRAERLLDLLT